MLTKANTLLDEGRAPFAEALTGRTLLPVSNYKAEWTYNVERNFQSPGVSSSFTQASRI